MQRVRYFRSGLGAATSVAAAFGAGLLLAGCAGMNAAGGGSATGSPVAAANVVTLQGKVHGGAQPISGAQILLYAAGTGGPGTATSLLTTSVQTGAYGEFDITGDYACPSADSQIYVLAKGGATGGGINAKSLLMSALGRCGDLSSSTYVSLSEVSTVATVYALQQFMTPGTMDISSSAGGSTGLANAFRMANNLVDGSTGQARATTVAGNGIVPQSTINALANIMAACVNTRGTDVVCQSLFSNAAPAGGVAPAETLTAMLDIALNPGTAHGTALYNLQPAVAPFQPTLTSAPNDWTLSVEYSGGGLSYPEMPAVDAQGNIWVPNAVSPGTLTELSPTGAVLSPAQGYSGGGLNNPFASAVDLAGNVWSANFGNNSVSEHASTGAALSPAMGYVAAGLAEPNAIAVDALGQVFTTNQNNSVTKLSNSGAAIATILNGGLNDGFAVAVDASQNIWVANMDGSSVSKFSNAGTAATTVGYSGGGLSAPVWVAVDAAGDAWLANADSSTVSEFNSSGVAMSAGYNIPAPASSLAIDGSNTIWTTNADGSISHLSSSGVLIGPATGYTSPNLTAGVGLVIDGSGNVWSTDIYVDSVFQFVGVATPVVTPLAKAVQLSKLGARP